MTEEQAANLRMECIKLSFERLKHNNPLSHIYMDTITDEAEIIYNFLISKKKEKE